MNKQPLKREKTISSIISVITALGILVGGTLVAVKPKVKTPVNPKPSTSHTDEVNNSDELLLTEDFDISSKEEVRKRAEAIYNLSEKTLSIEKIMDLIYYFNGKYENLSFASLNDKEKKFAKLQELGLSLQDLLNDNINDDINKLTVINEKENNEVNVKNDSEIYSYMLMPQTNAAKELALDYAVVINKQLEDIKLANDANFKINAEAFESIAKTIRETKDLKDGEYVLLYVDEQTKTALFGNQISKEMSKLIYLNEHNTYLNSIGFEASKKIGAYKEATKMEQVTTTPTTERYNQSDKKDAQNKVSNSKEETTKIVDKGGNKVPNSPGKTEVVSQGTTKVEEHTFVVTVPTTDPTTKFIPGGEVITEIYEDVKDADKYIDADSTTFVVDAGGQPVRSLK